jgi:putative aldouronate transport system permease protein
MKNTILLGIYKILFAFPAPIILALLLNELRHQIFKRIIQSVGYAPHFLSTVIVVSMTTVLLSADGFLVELFGKFGLDANGILYKPEYFRTIYILTEIWQHVGWETIIYMAALSTIDPQLYEAAHVDGAGRFRKILNVTLPGIAPTIIILLILNIGQIIEIGFEKVFLLYNPAVYSTADVISTYVYRMAFLESQFSYGAAIDFFNSIISLILIVGANYISKKVSETSLY